MLKKIVWANLAVSVMCVGLFAKQAEKKVPKKEAYKAVWQKIYGGKSDDIAYGIVALENGDSAIVGSCRSFGAKRTDMCVTRMNAKGETKWRLWIGGKRNDLGRAITRAADGNLLLLGESKSFSKEYDYDLYVAKVSLDGKLLWTKTIGGSRDEHAGGIAGTDDGGAILVGDSESFKNGYKDIYVVRIDKNGKVLSEKAIGGERDEKATAITRTRGGNFVLVGSREFERSGDSDFFAMKVDQNAKVIWSKSFGGDDEDVLNGVCPTIDGGVVATGSTRSYNSEQTDLSVLKLDKNGKLIWLKLYGFKYYEYGNAVTLTRDGGYMVAGGTNTLGKGDHSPYFLALDPKGSLIWSHVYGDKGKDIMHGIARMSDGSLIAVGQSNSFSRSYDFYMIKLRKQ
jgi:hypothetical protein